MVDICFLCSPFGFQTVRHCSDRVSIIQILNQPNPSDVAWNIETLV
jgi:hypothetical protein